MRLIDVKNMEKQIKEAFHENPFLMGMLLRWIRKQPTIDAVPVVHGRWAEKERIMYDSMREDTVHWFTYVCSVCDGEVMNNTNYCPNCGAHMKDGDGK